MFDEENEETPQEEPTPEEPSAPEEEPAAPEEVIRLAVRGMLPRTRLGRAQLRKLKVYAGPDHPHEAQKPQSLEVEA